MHQVMTTAVRTMGSRAAQLAATIKVVLYVEDLKQSNFQ